MDIWCDDFVRTTPINTSFRELVYIIVLKRVLMGIKHGQAILDVFLHSSMEQCLSGATKLGQMFGATTLRDQLQTIPIVLIKAITLLQIMHGLHLIGIEGRNCDDFVCAASGGAIHIGITLQSTKSSNLTHEQNGLHHCDFLVDVSIEEVQVWLNGLNWTLGADSFDLPCCDCILLVTGTGGSSGVSRQLDGCRCWFLIESPSFCP